MSNLSSHRSANAAIPVGACDCHTHVFLDAKRFPFAPQRKYTPPEATDGQLFGLLEQLQVERVVIVQPSVYGTDNAATLRGIAVLGQERARGVAVIDERTTGAELDRLATAGVRGVRVNLELSGEADPKRSADILRRTSEQLAGRGWHIQIYSHLSLIAALADAIAMLPVPVVLDHFAGVHASKGLHQSGLRTVLDLAATGRIYVKLSAAYRCSTEAPRYADLQPIAEAFIAANPERMVWGSDWPHPDPGFGTGRRPTDLSPALPVDDLRVLSLLREWAGDAATHQKILVDNPARLYDFPLPV